MKKIDINIDKAQILSYSVYLDEDSPRVVATIGLYTSSGKKMSEYSIDTASYQETRKFELPIGIQSPIIEIMKKLEVVVVKHMNEGQKQLVSNLPF